MLTRTRSGSDMDFRLFGPFEVWHEDAQVPVGDLQQRLVLVILLLHANHTVTKEHLQEYLWRGQKKSCLLYTSPSPRD